MNDEYINDPLLDVFIFETNQLIEQLEQSVLSNELESCEFTQDSINEIFRIMHTIKGSSAIMMFDNISALAHKMEDIFYYLREEKPKILNFSELSDLLLAGVDFIKCEMDKIKANLKADGDSSSLIHMMQEFLSALKKNNGTVAIEAENTASDKKSDSIINTDENLPDRLNPDQAYTNTFSAVIYFEDGCEMENIRAYNVIRNLKTIADRISYIPEDLLDNDNATEIIRREGFRIRLQTDYTYEMLHDFLMQTIFLNKLELQQLDTEKKDQQQEDEKEEKAEPVESVTRQEILNKAVEDNSARDLKNTKGGQSIISVSVAKLDKLMDLIGEMVITEAMVVQNPDLKGLELENFQKAARQLNKITVEMQDMVMSIRMVPLSATFNKMHRVVRDMCKKLGKEAKLEIIGDTTEVDKNIIEHISDPLMHIVRNAIDHGIESPDERVSKGKDRTGVITLEAKNEGSDVLIIVRDDGRGLDRDRIIKKAKENNLLTKNENELSDKEIINLILLPGFSTKTNVTEFSGRGVGMDVVSKNIEEIGGSLLIDSVKDKGTQITLKIPLTLAIIDGMNIRVGSSSFTIPLMSIKESFRPADNNVFSDTDNNEIIMVRGICYPIIRLHKIFGIDTNVTNLSDGIIIMIEQGDNVVCLFADELLGQQQVVVKAMPEYIQRFKKIRGLSGCTLLGDGSISLIIDVAGLINM